VSWPQLLAQRRVHPHTTSKQELDGLRALIDRDLAGADLPALSADRRFATAYNAALKTPKMATACSGYRVAAVPGHHRLQHFEAARLALGPGSDRFLDYFEASRRKRNLIDDDSAYIATGTKAAELLAEAESFRAYVERWIASVNPAFT
jgi:hypothetical protein